MYVGTSIHSRPDDGRAAPGSARFVHVLVSAIKRLANVGTKLHISFVNPRMQYTTTTVQYAPGGTVDS